MLDAEQLDDTLTERGHTPPDALAPDSERLVTYFRDDERHRLAVIAQRAWVVAVPNHGFGALEHGYGRYADMLSQLFDRIEFGIEEIADYSLSRDGEPGVLLGVDTGEESKYYWKPTGFRRDRCHPDLIERAANTTLERADRDERVVTLASDTIVALAVVPGDVVELLQLALETEAVTRSDAPETPRMLSEREFDDLPKRNA